MTIAIRKRILLITVKEIKQTQTNPKCIGEGCGPPAFSHSEGRLAEMGSADKTVMVFRSRPKTVERKRDRYWKETLSQLMSNIYFILILIFHWREGQNLHLNGNI